VVRDAVHLDEAIAALGVAVRERAAVLADAEASRSELTAVNAALVRKVAHLVNLDDGAIDESAAQVWRAKFDAQRADLDRSVAELRETLALFCQQAYPEKEALDPITRVPRKHSLRLVINQLLEAYASGESTYVSCEHVWPPYVELLLRANIAEIHAQDNRLLCLVDFRGH
jgi:hypothetical protein